MGFDVSFLKNRKGSVLDILYILIVLLVFALIIVMVYKIGLIVNDKLQGSSAFDDATKVRTQTLIVDRMPVLMNYGFMVALIFLWLGALASAYMSDVSPAFFFLGIMLVIIFVVISGAVANIYADFAAMKAIQTQAAQFTILTWVFQHYILIAIVMGFSMLGVTYAKMRLT